MRVLTFPVGTLVLMPPLTLALAWSVDDAARVLGPRADRDLLLLLVDVLGVPEVEPGKYDAADLLGLHDAIGPWLRRRDDLINIASDHG
jgi:hypothetical protein